MASVVEENGREAIRLERVTKRHGTAFAIEDVSLSVYGGEILALIGHTGAGKSSLLRLIAGLDRPDSGSVHIGGNLANDIPPHRRGIAFVFQRDVHYPGRTLMSDWLDAERAGTFDRWQALGGWKAELSDAFKLNQAKMGQPLETLSGGEARRASLLRAILRDQPILLADEPLTGLDLWTRDSVSRFLWRFIKATGKTMIVVAHEPVESFGLADRLAVMHKGQLVQCGPAEELLADPRHPVAVSLLQFPPWNVVGVIEIKLRDFESPHLHIERLIDPDANLLIERSVAPHQCVVTTQVVSDKSSIPVRLLRRRWTPSGRFVEWRHAESAEVFWSPELPDLPESGFLTWNPTDEFWFEKSEGIRFR